MQFIRLKKKFGIKEGKVCLIRINNEMIFFRKSFSRTIFSISISSRHNWNWVCGLEKFVMLKYLAEICEKVIFQLNPATFGVLKRNSVRIVPINKELKPILKRVDLGIKHLMIIYLLAVKIVRLSKESVIRIVNT